MLFKNLFSRIIESWLDHECLDAKAKFERLRLIIKKSIKAKNQYCTNGITQSFVLSYQITKHEGKNCLELLNHYYHGNSFQTM